MRMGFVAVVCLTVAGFSVPTSLALAEQKTVATCQAEWRANKAIYQPKGITEEEYVEECRDFTAPPADRAPKSASRQAKHVAAHTPSLTGKPVQTSPPNSGEGKPKR
jgi:hypothetical protein